jgi:hypothetical protein
MCPYAASSVAIRQSEPMAWGMDVEEKLVAQLVAAIRADFPDETPPAPRGWPGEAEAALIDAVFSMRANYGNSETTGVRRIVRAWRNERRVPDGALLDDLRVLAGYDPERLADLVGNHQRVPGPNAITKAAAIVVAAGNLVSAGYANAAALASDGPKGEASRAYRAVPGLGFITWTYLLMLLGVPGVKADVMICRYVTRALDSDQELSPAFCAAAVTAAADRLGIGAVRLDNAIWALQRTKGVDA